MLNEVVYFSTEFWYPFQSLNTKPECEVFVPLIVLSGKLFIGKLGNSKIELSEENNISVFWRNNVLDAPHSMILVNTFENLDSLVSKAKKEFDVLGDKLKDHCEFILNEINRKTSPSIYLQ